MENSLLKELKDAGFPKSSFRCVRDIEPIAWVGVPTLSELFAAIPMMSYWSIEQHSNDWRAGLPDKSVVVSGKTPEEAVARLWLKLQPLKSQS